MGSHVWNTRSAPAQTPNRQGFNKDVDVRVSAFSNPKNCPAWNGHHAQVASLWLVTDSISLKSTLLTTSCLLSELTRV